MFNIFVNSEGSEDPESSSDNQDETPKTMPIREVYLNNTEAVDNQRLEGTEK